MGRFQAITVTPAAAARVKHLLAIHDKPAIGLRVGVRNRGCSGMSYTVDYAEEKNTFDEAVEIDGALVLIDAKATMFLIGTEMDFVEDKMQSGFTFRNPNEKARCGCGESFSV